jgi:hypothetical protein
MAIEASVITCKMRERMLKAWEIHLEALHAGEEKDKLSRLHVCKLTRFTNLEV